MNSVFKCDYKQIKRISCKMRAATITENELNIIDNYYKEYYLDNSGQEIRIRCIIENSLYKNIENLGIAQKLHLSDKGNEMTFVMFYMMYITKHTDAIIKKYFSILSRLGLSRGCFKRFIAIYIISKHSLLQKELLMRVLLTDCERENLVFLLESNNKSIKKIKSDNVYVKLIKLIEFYMYLNKTVIYDDDILKNILTAKNKVDRYSQELGCNNVINHMVDKKIKYFKSKFVSNSDLKPVRKFRFKSNIVQNTVFIRSKLDKWYVDVDKETNECILYHENDGGCDKYHYQKTFNSAKLYRVFKYIKEHDEYCLRVKKINM